MFECVDPDIGPKLYILCLKVFKILYVNCNFYYVLVIIYLAQICGVSFFKDKPWWRSGDKTDPFNGGVLYIKRKVGSCSYVDDPVGCQSLLSRVMHIVLTSFFLQGS